MKARGFTLIEVLVSIVMVSFAAVIMVTYMNSGITKSTQPLSTMNDNYTAFRTLEIINADYRARLEANPSQPIGFYVSDNLADTIPSLAGLQAKGDYTDFSDPDENRKVHEIETSGPTIYVRVESSRNNSKMVTILGN